MWSHREKPPTVAIPPSRAASAGWSSAGLRGTECPGGTWLETAAAGRWGSAGSGGAPATTRQKKHDKSDQLKHPQGGAAPPERVASGGSASGWRGYLAELLSQSFLGDSQRPHPSDPTGCLNLVHIQTLHSFLCNQLKKHTRRYPASQRSAAVPLSAIAEICTLSSARMALSFMMSWKRRKLLVPMDWSSRRRQRATS